MRLDDVSVIVYVSTQRRLFVIRLCYFLCGYWAGWHSPHKNSIWWMLLIIAGFAALLDLVVIPYAYLGYVRMREWWDAERG